MFSLAKFYILLGEGQGGVYGGTLDRVTKTTLRSWSMAIPRWIQTNKGKTSPQNPHNFQLIVVILYKTGVFSSILTVGWICFNHYCILGA